MFVRLGSPHKVRFLADQYDWLADPTVPITLSNLFPEFPGDYQVVMHPGSYANLYLVGEIISHRRRDHPKDLIFQSFTLDGALVSPRHVEASWEERLPHLEFQIEKLLSQNQLLRHWLELESADFHSSQSELATVTRQLKPTHTSERKKAYARVDKAKDHRDSLGRRNMAVTVTRLLAAQRDLSKQLELDLISQRTNGRHGLMMKELSAYVDQKIKQVGALLEQPYSPQSHKRLLEALDQFPIKPFSFLANYARFQLATIRSHPVEVGWSNIAQALIAEQLMRNLSLGLSEIRRYPKQLHPWATAMNMPALQFDDAYAKLSQAVSTRLERLLQGTMPDVERLAGAAKDRMRYRADISAKWYQREHLSLSRSLVT